MAPNRSNGVEAICARYSSELQNPRSIADQIADLGDEITRQGGDPSSALVFSDAETSGSVRPEDRPGLRELLRAVETGRIRQVYVEHPDRLSRDLGDADRIAKVLLHHDVRLVCLNGTVLDGSAGSLLTFGVTAVISDNYLRELGAKTRRGLQGNAREGKATGGRTYGYRTNSERLIEVVPEEAATVRRIFALYQSGIGYASIAAVLNAEGSAAPRGRRRAGNGWMASCIREMLRNPKYVGQWTFGVREWRKHPTTRKRVARPRDESRVFRAERPELAIVDRSVWDVVQGRLARHAERSKQREISDRKSAHLVSGLLRCGKCGALMQIAGGSIPRYRCSANTKRGTCDNSVSVREAELRQAILNGIAERLSSPETFAIVKRRVAEFLKRQAAEKNTRLGTLKKDLGALKVRLAQSEDRLKKLYLRWADGDDRDETLGQLIAELRAEVAEDRASLAELSASAEHRIEAPTAKEVAELSRYIVSLQYLNELDAEFDDADPPEVRAGKGREALRAFLKDGRITMTPDAASGSYIVDTTVLPLALLHKTATPPGGREAYDVRGCAGRI